MTDYAPRRKSFASNPRWGSRFRPSFSSVRLSVAILLLIAAAAKARVMGIAAGSLSVHEWPQLIGLSSEFLFGVWLLSGRCPKVLRWSSVAWISVFACIAFAKGVMGLEGCGCFGDIEISPWVTFTLDLAIVRVLAVASTTDSAIITRYLGSNRLRWAAVLVVVAIFCTAIAFPLRSPLALSAGVTFDGHGLHVLPTDAWIGERLPLLEFFDIGDELQYGWWTLIFYRSNCNTCNEAPLRLQDGPPSSAMVAVIELPPQSRDNAIRSSFKYGRLDALHGWKLPAPLVIEISSERVTRIYSSRDAAGAVFQKLEVG